MSFKFNKWENTQTFFVDGTSGFFIQYVENNLTIIQCKNGDFSLNLSKVTSFFSFSESPVS